MALDGDLLPLTIALSRIKTPFAEGRVEGSGRGTMRVENAQETPTQSHISPSILVHEDQQERLMADG